MTLNKLVMFVAMAGLGFQLLATALLGKFNLAMPGGYFVTGLLMYTAGFLIVFVILETDIMEVSLLGLAIALTNHIKCYRLRLSFSDKAP